jgi:MFS family permease
MGYVAHGEHKHHLRGLSRFFPVYGAMLLLSLHWALVTYINSSYLEQFIVPKYVGLLYIGGSLATIGAFLCITRILRRYGNYRLAFILATLEILFLILLAFVHDPRLIIPLFILHHAVVPVLLFNIDIFMEGMIGKQESHTGGRRGLLLTVMSLAGAVAPLGTGFLVGGSIEPRFYLAYVVSAFLMVPFVWIIYISRYNMVDPHYRRIELFSSLKYFWNERNLRYVFCAHFLLQLFFSWMVIYVPLYLSKVLQFDWREIGIIIFVGLLAYVIFEYPIGEIADRYIGEKEMMAVGFLIIAISTVWLGFISSAALIPWAVTMFMTRIGASLVETTSESYFFKHIEGSDANIIGFFRITRPLAYSVGALIGSLTLLFIPFSLLFVVLGCTMCLGIPLSLLLKDTR